MKEESFKKAAELRSEMERAQSKIYHIERLLESTGLCNTITGVPKIVSRSDIKHVSYDREFAVKILLNDKEKIVAGLADLQKQFDELE